MITRTFDPKLPHPFAFYGRMSDPRQNERSPEQQWDTCQREIERLAYPWRKTGHYVDRGITGRLLRARTQFWRLITDIRTGILPIDLVVVDTFERFGRAEELDSLRRELCEKHGVLVVCADTRFDDPTTSGGKILAKWETIRATEDGRIKSHNVVRGKRDAVKSKHWPGGPPPFGYRLNQVIVEKNGQPGYSHTELIRDPRTDWIILRAYKTAVERAWGSTRVTKSLNNDPEIPDEFKPFLDPTVNHWLQDGIYVGTLTWGEHCTDIKGDRRVIERSDPSDVMIIPGFCEPILPVDLFNTAQAQRKARCERMKSARSKKLIESDKLIRPIAPGLALKYALSGLIRCGLCNRAMTIMSSAEYVTKAGEKKRYISYRCPGAISGVCSNRQSISEPWLREVVADLIVRRLFKCG